MASVRSTPIETTVHQQRVGDGGGGCGGDGGGTPSNEGGQQHHQQQQHHHQQQQQHHQQQQHRDRGNAETGRISNSERKGSSVAKHGLTSRTTSFRSNNARTPLSKQHHNTSGDHFGSSSPAGMVARGGGGGGDDGGGGGGGGGAGGGGGGGTVGDRESSLVLNSGSRTRRITPDISRGPRDNNCTTSDRRLSNPAGGGRGDSLRRSRDTSVPDTPNTINGERRGGHGRDGPNTAARESTVIAEGGNGVGGGDRDRGPVRSGAGGERDRGTTFRGTGVGGGGGGCGGGGDEELLMEVPGRYERMRVLGRGSFGAVTLVKDNRDSKLYAMKTLNCSDKLEEKQTAMDEVRLLRWLKHPSILTLFDTFLSSDGRLVCLTTTYCESGDLAKIVKHAAKTKCLLGEKTVLGWFTQLCLGVHHLHEEKKVLHRDIKPNNVFLMDSKKIVQLGDFGLARVIKDGDNQVKTEVGTPYYTSPEMCNNLPYGFPSDVWSLGIVLFELLALDVPFRSRDVVALVSQVIKAPPPPLPEVYSQEATALARWMLQKDPHRRPTLTRILACQPLRRHMNSFVKNYRPMNKSERQRRHDIKDLESQVAFILENGGDDPQIPADVDDGCGSLPLTVGQEDTFALHGSGSGAKSQPLEERGLGGEIDVNDGGGGGGGLMTAAITRAVTADSVVRGRNHSVGKAVTEGLATVSASLSTDDEPGGVGGACARCGARAPCACGNGYSGTTTPGGRRFGSPRPSKGARSVMSWRTPPMDRDEKAGEGEKDGYSSSGGRRGSRLSSDGRERNCSGDGNRDSGGGGDGTGGGDSGGGGRGGRNSDGSSLESSGLIVTADDKKLSGRNTPSCDSARRKRNRSTRFSTASSDDRNNTFCDVVDNSGVSSVIYTRSPAEVSAALEPARRPSSPRSPRSPRSPASSNPRRKSGGGSRAIGLNDSNDRGRCNSEKASLGGGTEEAGRGVGDVKNAGGDTCAVSVTQMTHLPLAVRIEQERESGGDGDGGDAGLPLGYGAVTRAAKTERRRSSDSSSSSSSSSKDSAIVGSRQSSSAARIVTAAAPGITKSATPAIAFRGSPQTPRSACLPENSSKTGKRLSEALTFAAAVPLSDRNARTMEHSSAAAAAAVITNARGTTAALDGAESTSSVVPVALAMETSAPNQTRREDSESSTAPKERIQGTAKRRSSSAAEESDGARGIEASV